jgi:hypothetical protein
MQREREVAVSGLPDGQISDLRTIRVQSSLKKYFALPVGQIICITSRRSAPQEGRFAIVTNVGAGCGGRFSRERRTRVKRTAKSRGPDAPTLASSWRDDPPVMVARKPDHQGEREGNR